MLACSWAQAQEQNECRAAGQGTKAEAKAETETEADAEGMAGRDVLGLGDRAADVGALEKVEGHDHGEEGSLRLPALALGVCGEEARLLELADGHGGWLVHAGREASGRGSPMASGGRAHRTTAGRENSACNFGQLWVPHVTWQGLRTGLAVCAVRSGSRARRWGRQRARAR